MNHKKTLSEMLEVVAPGGLGITFECMSVAEKVLSREFGGKENEPEGIFLALCPSAPLRDKSLVLYARHAEELCARAAAGQDVNPATDAELLAAICDTSLVAPLTTSGSAVAGYLFAKVFKGRAIGPGRAYAAWAGQALDEVAKMRSKFSVPRGGILTKKGGK
jgi:hypothetical protein